MIFRNQTFILSVNVGQDLSSATDTKILYTKPNGVPGEWVATVSGTSLTYSTANDDIDQDGVWKVQPFYKIAGANKYGKIVKFTVDEHI